MRKVHKLPINTGERGLSLVEGLVAAALVGLGFLAVLSLYPSAYSTLSYAGNEILAAQYAAQKIEQLKPLVFSAIDANCVNSCENLGSGFCRSCALTINAGTGSLVGDLKRITVTVTWTAQTRPGTLSVDTLFTR